MLSNCCEKDFLQLVAFVTPVNEPFGSIIGNSQVSWVLSAELMGVKLIIPPLQMLKLCVLTVGLGRMVAVTVRLLLHPAVVSVTLYSTLIAE